MRTLLNADKSYNLSDTIVPQIKFKLWSERHLELEFHIDKYGRYPVLHMISYPSKKTITVATSFEDFYDFILEFNFHEFSSLYLYPKTSKLFKNTYDKVKNDAFLSRAIEPYSKEIHWFLCVEVSTLKSVKFTNDNFENVMDENEKLFDMLTGLIELGDQLVDDVNPSTWQAMRRGFTAGVIEGTALYLESFSTAPKWLEFLKEVGDWGEKIQVYESRFCRDELFEEFTK